MKRILCVVFAAMLAFAAMPIGVGATGFAETAAETETVLADGFENGISAWWRTDGGTLTASSGVGGRETGDHSALFETAGAASVRRYVNGANGAFVAVRASVFVQDLSAERSLVINGNETLVKFAADGSLTSGANDTKIGTYSANRWYNILAVITTGETGTVASGNVTHPTANYRIFINGNEAESDGLLTSETISSVSEIGFTASAASKTYIDEVYVENCSANTVENAKDTADFGTGSSLYGSTVYVGEMPAAESFSRNAAKAKTWFEFNAENMPKSENINGGASLTVGSTPTVDNSYAVLNASKADAPNLRINGINNSIGDEKHFWVEGDFVLNMKAGDRFVPLAVGNNENSCFSLVHVYAADETYADIAPAFSNGVYTAIGKYKMGEKVNFACDVNVKEGTYDIYMNGVLLKKENAITDTSNLGTASEAIKHFRMTLVKAKSGVESSISIDNIKFFTVDSSGSKALVKDYACGSNTFALNQNKDIAGAELNYATGAIDGAKPFNMLYKNADNAAFVKKALTNTGVADIAGSVLEFDSAFSSLANGKVWYVGFRFKGSANDDKGVNLVRFTGNSITDANSVSVGSFAFGERKNIAAKITGIDTTKNKLYYDLYIDGAFVKSVTYTPGTSWKFSAYSTVSEMRCGVANNNATEALVYDLKMYREDNATTDGLRAFNSDFSAASGTLAEGNVIFSSKNGVVNVYEIKSGSGGKLSAADGAAAAEYEDFGTAITPMLVAGAYDGGKLKCFGAESFSYDAGQGLFTSSVELDEDSGLTYRAFIWDSLNGMKPISGN